MHPASQNIISLYRRHAVVWAQRRVARGQEHKWLRAFIAAMPARRFVLDIGRGTGFPIGRYLCENGCQLVGVDASPELIEIARARVPEATFVVADMRSFSCDQQFDGILGWHSTFHLTPADQRRMFPIFQKHAADGAALMFTSGTSLGDAIGEFEGEPLYHGSLDPDEYRTLLDQHGFTVLDHVTEDPECGGATVWLAQYTTP